MAVTTYRYKGEALTLKAWAKKTGINQKTIAARLDRGWSVADALTKPVQKQGGHHYWHKDHRGEKHGLLTVVKCLGNDSTGQGIRWLCKCKCGGKRIVYAKQLTSVKDCGCRRSRRKTDPVRTIQPCWTCEKYAGGCSWTRKNPAPIEGWDAVPTVKYQGRGGEMHSFAIRYCPEYVPDGTDGRE